MVLKQYIGGIQIASTRNLREEVYSPLSDFDGSLANMLHRIGRGNVIVLLTKQQKKRLKTLNRL